MLSVFSARSKFFGRHEIRETSGLGEVRRGWQIIELLAKPLANKVMMTTEGIEGWTFFLIPAVQSLGKMQLKQAR